MNYITAEEIYGQLLVGTKYFGQINSNPEKYVQWNVPAMTLLYVYSHLFIMS